MIAIEDEDGDGFNITCIAFGLYPEPEIKLFKVQSINESLESDEVKSNTTTVLSLMANGFSSIKLTSHIEPNPHNNGHGHMPLEISPARARLLAGKNFQPNTPIAEHFECRLSIPNTDYIEVKRLAIQDGKCMITMSFPFFSSTSSGKNKFYFSRKNQKPH